MKSFVAALLIPVMLSVFACSQPAVQKPSGKYYQHWKTSYSVAVDTLFIRKLDDTEPRYAVEKHTGYRAIRHGELRAKRIKFTKWIAAWDEQSHTLSEGPGGRELWFKGDSLMLGEHAYQRIP